MKSKKIINAYDKIELDEAAEMRMLDKAMQKQYKKRPVFKMVTAAAAIVCFIIIGCLMFNPVTTNEFSIKAYAMDTEDEHEGMRPINGGEGGWVSVEGWHGYFVDKGDIISFYTDIGWQIEGENLKRAEITVDDGYFLKKLEGYEFEEIGNTVILEKEDIHKGDMLYVGYDKPVTYVEREITSHGENAATGETWEETKMEEVAEYEMVEEIVLHAVVTYDNGETEEKDMIFTLEEAGFAGYSNLDSMPK